MREIKAQAWDEKRKTMFTPYYRYLPKGVTRKRDFFIGFNGSGLEVSEYEGKGFWRRFPIRLFTGIKDCNEKEVYENDVISISCDCDAEYGCFHGTVPYTVTWDDETCGYAFRRIRDGKLVSIDNFCVAFIEVIGNIYEHPHLLGGKTE